MKMRAFISTWILLLTVFFVLPVHGKGNPQLNEALLQAAEKGDLREVRALIAKGADVNAGRKNPVTGVTDQTALTFAYQARHMDVVLELLNKGADIKAGWLPPYAERDIDVYRADLEINRIYNKLLGTLNPQQQKALREEQEAWIKRRDAEADRIARSISVCCGSAYTHDYLTAKLDLIRKRIEVLERYTANNSPKPVPTPTPPPSMSKAQSPRIEKASLKRDFVTTDQRYMYLFDFDFVNALEQPIEIISVNVFDVNGDRLKQDWAMSGPNADTRLLTHELSGNHPLVKIFSKPGRGTPLEQAIVSSVGGRMEIKVTNRILSAGQGIRPSGYILGSKNKYDSLILRVTYRVNGNLREVSHTFTTGLRDEAKPPSTPEPQPVPTPTSPVAKPVPTPMPREPKGTGKYLIVLVHGCCTDNKNDLREWDELGGKIHAKIENKKEWEVVVRDWTDHTKPPGNPVYYLNAVHQAYEAAPSEGKKLASLVAAAINRSSVNSYEYVHLIAHSAGAKLIHEASKKLASDKLKKRPFIHLTFLDAYTWDDKDTNSYGSLAEYPEQVSYPEHYAEHYVDIGRWYTDALLSNAFNFDITDWQPISHQNPDEKKDGGHQWPRYWYLKSITESGFKYGFTLSLAGSGGSARFKELANKWPVSNPPQPCILKNTTTENPLSCDFKKFSSPSPVPTPPRP